LAFHSSTCGEAGILPAVPKKKEAGATQILLGGKKMPPPNDAKNVRPMNIRQADSVG